MQANEVIRMTPEATREFQDAVERAIEVAEASAENAVTSHSATSMPEMIKLHLNSEVPLE